MLLGSPSRAALYAILDSLRKNTLQQIAFAKSINVVKVHLSLITLDSQRHIYNPTFSDYVLLDQGSRTSPLQTLGRFVMYVHTCMYVCMYIRDTRRNDPRNRQTLVPISDFHGQCTCTAAVVVRPVRTPGFGPPYSY